MSLHSGDRIGPYEVLGLLGVGGMGEVYRARDTVLQRDVAIKVLPAALAADSRHLAWFEREATVLASLNHPNVATIHGLEHLGDGRALVMELVEGPTLAERLKRGPLPIGEVLSVARQLSSGLDAAHGRGIVHRDLKPANIKVRPDGTVKVLDFGLAKSFLLPGRVSGNEGDVTRADPSATGTGVIVGTASYMSPEQARGEPVDARTDVWAYGCVVFEMLTGHSLFGRATTTDTLVAVMTHEPDWSALPPETPIAMRRVLERCLARDPARRLRDIAAAAQMMEGDDAPTASAALPAVESGRARRLPSGGVAVAIALAAVAVAGAAALMWSRAGGPATAPVRKFDLTITGLGDKPVTFAGETGPGAGVVISPDGRRLVYPADGRLWVRELDQLDPKSLTGTDGAISPAWSPDSQWVAFAAGSELKKAPAAGGPAVTIATLRSPFIDASGAAWSADNVITYTAGSGSMMAVPAGGGDPHEVLELKGEQDFHDATALPDGRGVLFVAHYPVTRHVIEALTGAGRITIKSFDATAIRHPVFSPSGHILYQRVSGNPGVWALPIDRATLQATGEPFIVGPNGLRPSVASDGTLVYVSDDSFGLVQMSLVDRKGAVVADVGEPGRGLKNLDLSPDDRRAAFIAAENERDEVWVVDVRTGSRTRLTNGGVRGHAAWSPRGDRVTFSCSGPNGEDAACAAPADGSAPPTVIEPLASMPRWSPDGTWLTYIMLGSGSRTDIWAHLVSGAAAPTLVVRTPAFEYNPEVSPDGRLLLYGSAKSGAPEVYVTRFPSGLGDWRVSTAAGGEPRWNPRGREAFYMDGRGRLMSVPVEPGDPPSIGTPAEVFPEAVAGIHLASGYAPSSDGQRFLVVRDVGRDKAHTRVAIVQNWFAEFAGRASDRR